MRKTILPIFLGLAAAGWLGMQSICAQDAPKKGPNNIEEAEEEKPKAKPEAEESEKSEAEQEKEAMEKELAQVRKMLAVFRTLEGEWTGTEKIEYNHEIEDFKDRKAKTWHDEWKGFYTQEGRFFEMTGKTDGDMVTTYHWYVTYETEAKEYRAWNFGTTGFSEYVGELSDDGKAVVWSKTTEGAQMSIEDTFELRADGNRCSAKGETRFVSKDGQTSIDYAKQSSSYTRKKIEI